MMRRGMAVGGQSSSSFLLIRLSAIGSWLLLLWWCCTVTTATGATESEDFDDYRFDGSVCEFYQLIEPGNKSYYLYSPGYPEPYQEAQQDRECQWFAKTPSPTDRLVLDCHEFDLPEVCSMFTYSKIVKHPVATAAQLLTFIINRVLANI